MLRLSHGALHLELSHCLLQVAEPELAPPNISPQSLCLRMRLPQSSSEILVLLLPLCSRPSAELDFLNKPLHTPLETLSLSLQPESCHLHYKAKAATPQGDLCLSGM